MAHGSWKMRKEGGGEGEKTKKKKGGEGERWEERKQSERKAMHNASRRHVWGGEGRCIYSIGFQWKQIELTIPEIYHIDYQLRGKSSPWVQSLKGSAFMVHHQGSRYTEAEIYLF